jgi:hypothetical protein
MVPPPHGVVAIAGASVAGAVLAAELARAGRRVVLAAPPLRETRRLVAGSSLRGATIRHLAAAFGRAPGEVVATLTGGRGTFSRVASGPARRLGSGRIRFGRPLVFRAGPEIAGLSTRHGQILRGLAALMEPLPITRVDRPVAGLPDLLGLAGGEGGALLVDATGRADRFAAPRPPARRVVLAAQAPCVPLPGGPRPPLAPGTAYAPLFAAGEDGVHLAFFTPFHDDLSPAASWYGIDTQIVAAAHAAGPEPAVRTLDALARALGLALHDAPETLAQAAIPIDERFDDLGAPGAISTSPLLSSGAAAIYVDGMLAQAAGARALAAAILRGDPEPRAAVGPALAGIRARNRAVQAMMTMISPSLAALPGRLFPGPVAAWLARDW